MTINRETFYQRRGKRLFDLSAAVAIGIMTLPVQAGVAALVARKLGRPVLFRQQRPGRDGKPFYLVKFRTMTNALGPDGTLLPNDQRITDFGVKLRSSSLDELPEILNVIRGEMSLVGPRPLLMDYLDRYTADEARRHHALPGITGLAQVSGRNDLDWSDKFALDIQYVDSISFRLDLGILLRTIASVVGRRGIGHGGEHLVSEFKGSGSYSQAR